MRGAPLEAILWGVVGMRKRMGIEPTVPPLARSTIGFEDRAAHQSQMRFRWRA